MCGVVAMITVEESIPRRGDSGLAARDIFYSHFNTVHFYIEDEEEENLYVEILRRLFEKIQITQIFPLRGKGNVLAHARDPVNATNAHRSIYILDKDFDDLLGHLYAKENVFYLERYCIENFLCEEGAVLQIALEAEPHRDKEELRKAINYAKYHESAVQSLDKLFRLFFIVQRFNLGLKNCDLKPEAFSVKDEPWQIDPAKVEAYEGEVQLRISGIGVFPSQKDYDLFLAAAFPPSKTADTHISGKFVMAMTYHHMRRGCKVGNVPADSIRYRLARNSELKSLESLGASIREYLERSLAAAAS
jgi:hypothetical protein